MQAKKTLSHLAAALLLAAPFTSALAQSSQSLDRVEVQRQALPRHDLSAACPRAQQTLEAGMARALSLDMLPGSYRVEFDLAGDRIERVHTPRAPLVYRKALRSALRAMDCQDAAARTSPQRFAFILDVKAEDGGRDTAVAGAASPRFSLALRAAD